MKVSVSIITYNHQNYISQAIDSVLMQKTNFDYEIIIGEDDSEDNTRAIVKEYKERYPDRIKLFLNSRENVIYVNRRPTGRWNAVNNLKHARGQYIALLDGDDYWTSPEKLQKQVQFLENHPECAICFHNVEILYEDSKEKKLFYEKKVKPFHTISDLALRSTIPTCSTMFRSRLFGEFPEWYYKMPMGDWPLNLLNAQYGDIGYIDEVLGVLRRHRGSFWQSKSIIWQQKGSICGAEIVKHHFGWKLRIKFNNKIGFHHYNIARILYKDRNFQMASVHAMKCLMNSPFSKRISRMFLLRAILRGKFPTMYYFLKERIIPKFPFL